MKEIFYFIQWQWNRFETWQRVWLFAMFCVGAGIPASAPYNQWLMVTGASIILLTMLKWVFYDGIKQSWTSYKKEQQEIVDIMKDSGK